MVKATPFDGCSPISNQTERAPILFMERGNCTFSHKAMNAQLAGAHLLIIIDNINEVENQL